MCGIAGILNWRDREARPHIKLMTQTLGHRGPDAEGSYEDEWVSLGHTRLAVIDLEDSSNQPFSDHTGRFVIVYNGEIYNFRELKDQLADYPFRTNSDTEVILAAFSKWGTDCATMFKGMFAFAIWDREEKVLTITRDRFGVKPLYFYQSADYFVFASEIRSILATGLVKKELDHEALKDFLSYQSFGFPDSPVSGIKQLRSGTIVQVSLGSMKSKTYWQLGGTAPQEDFSDPDHVKLRIRELFTDAVTKRLVSDVPIGAFLSGGIDSSAIVGMMAQVSEQRPITFNVSFKEERFDEARFATLVAKKFNTDHRVIQLTTDDFLDQLEMALNAMDSPSADGVNTYVVSRAVKEAGITVALSGVGGDELFAGYPFFKTIHGINKYRNLLRLTTPLRKVAAAIGMNARSQQLQRLSAMLDERHTDVFTMYPHFRKVTTSEKINSLLNIKWNGETLLENLLAERATKLNHLPVLSQITACEYLGYTQNTLLKDADQMSMAVALEVREPFFDHELVDFVLQVPDRIKYPSYPKSLFVEALKPLIPSEVVHRKKQGFAFPWELWMRNQLFSFCDVRIKRMAKREFIQEKELLRAWKDFLKGTGNVSWINLWMFVVLEHWMDRNNVD